MSMKKPILILFLSLLSLAAFSQQYYPLIEEGRSWNVLTVVPNWGPPFDSTCYTVNYLISGDSILNNTEYKKTYYSSEEIPTNWSLIGFIREDSVKRVWYRRIVDTNEVLIYDFSLLAGDSLKLGFDTTMYYKVDSITTEIVADSIRKKYWISQDDLYWKETWIEGIGSNRGILGSAMASAVGGWAWFLCMSDDGVLTYMNPDFDSCYINTGLKEMHKPDFRIYPNPFTDRITIDFFDNNIDNINIVVSVYNSTGQKIINMLALEIKQLTIDLCNMPGGIYYLTIQDDNKIFYTQKMIKN